MASRFRSYGMSEEQIYYIVEWEERDAVPMDVLMQFERDAEREHSLNLLEGKVKGEQRDWHRLFWYKIIKHLNLHEKEKYRNMR